MKKVSPVTRPKQPAQAEKPRRRNRGASFVTSRQLNGGHFSPPTNPPDVTAQPWYPLTLSWTQKPGSVTFDHVIKAFKAQLDPNSSGLNQEDYNKNTGKPLRVQFRFRRIQVWNLTGRALSLTVWDDLEQNNTDKDQLGGWTDCGGASTFPKIGFTYPYSHANRVHRPDPNLSATVVFQTTSSGQNDAILCNLALLWRFDGAVKVVGTLPSAEELLLSEISTLTQSIKDSQPSTVDKVIDGAKVAASVVAVAAGGFAQHCSDPTSSSPHSKAQETFDLLVSLVAERIRTTSVASSEFGVVDSDDGVRFNQDP